MADIRPFCAVRPSEKFASEVAALPYDVYNTSEAREAIAGHDKTFLRIDRAETAFEEGTDPYSEKVYKKASQIYQDMKANGVFITDENRCYYIYSLTMDGRKQTGIAAVSSVDDYNNNIIKKHENTRADKELDRINHVDTLSAQTGPIFLAYRANDVINGIVDKVVSETKPLYDFTSEDGVTHTVHVISDKSDIDTIEQTFAEIDSVYIADGHHRAASAVKVSLKRRESNPEYTGEEEFNFFLSVLFPDEQLMIMDYNRTVKDLNGLSEADFIKKISENFEVSEAKVPYSKPSSKGCFGMYLSGKWYDLKIHEKLCDNKDEVASLDVSYLQNYLLSPVLGIEDPRTDERIDFVGGIRGIAELEKRAESDMKVSFCMYPTSINELFAVADAGKLMPPKSTWFEPKLRSGLFIHEI